jgi:rhamnogalacturonyl hydrolase YesR
MKPRLALIPFLTAFFLLAFAPSTLRAANARHYAKAIKRSTRALQQWYSPHSGLYAPSAGWWNSANAITVLANESRALKTKRYLAAIDNTFENASAAEHTANFLNNYDDDEGWWALAWVDAYDLTANPRYLAMAETILADIAAQWETKTCGGGVWWNKKSGYKNAIANELFLELAASLANRAASADEKQKYLEWAEREWIWFRGTGMINAQGLVNDGLDSRHPDACVNNGRTTWSYNQGVILGGLVELYEADHDPALLPQAQSIANAVIAHLTNPQDILVDPSVEATRRSSRAFSCAISWRSIERLPMRNTNLSPMRMPGASWPTIGTRQRSSARSGRARSTKPTLPAKPPRSTRSSQPSRCSKSSLADVFTSLL